MYEIQISTQYKKGYKKLSKEDRNLVDGAIYALSQNQKLEEKYRDHKMQGEFKECRECHIKPDLLLIYKKLDKKLVLVCVNVGSHSDLF